MKALRHLVAFVSSLAACAGARPSTSTVSAVLDVLEQQRQAWNRGDLDGYMAGYARTPDLVFTSGGEIRRGWEATLAAYQKRYGTDRASMGKLAFDILGVQPVGDGGAIVLGRWRLTDTAQAGGGVFTVVFEHRGAEGWRIVHDHTSAAPLTQDSHQAPSHVGGGATIKIGGVSPIGDPRTCHTHSRRPMNR